MMSAEPPILMKNIPCSIMIMRMGMPNIGSSERMMTEEQPESPTVTAVSAIEVRNIRSSSTISLTRFIPPKK